MRFEPHQVAGICGVLNPAGELGFQTQVPRAAARSGLDGEALRRLRIQAYAAAAREWSNRGLGGNKAWGADEGREAADYLQGLGDGE